MLFPHVQMYTYIGILAWFAQSETEYHSTTNSTKKNAKKATDLCWEETFPEKKNKY